nr:hypothetical protein [Oscillospiraceae bacterium]
MKKQNDEITLRDFLNIFIPKIWLIALVAIVVAAGVGLYSNLRVDTYTSSAKYMLNKVNMTNPDEMIGLNASEVEAMGIMINNMEEIIRTNNFSNMVIETLAQTGNSTDGLTPESLKKMIYISKTDDETTCYYLSVTSEDASLSAVIADVAGELLVSEYERMHKYAITITRIDSPIKPSSPDGKGVLRNAFIGGVAGAIITMIFVFVISKLDVVIRSKEKIEQGFDIPIIGIIPHFESDN